MKKIRNFLTDTCILFTAFVFILYIAGYILVSNTITITLSAMFALFVSCFLLRVFHTVLHIKKLPFILRILIHYLLVVIAAYIGFVFIAKIVTNSLATFVLLLFVTLLYTAIAVVIALIQNKKKTVEDTKEYKSMF